MPPKQRRPPEGRSERRLPELGARPEQLEAALQLLPEGAALAERDGRIRFANAAAAQLLGQDALGASGLRLQDRVHPEDQCAFAETWERAITAEGVPLFLEARLLSGIDRPRWVRMALRNLPGAGVTLGILVQFSNIDGEKRAIEEAARREQRLALARQAARLGFWTFDVRENRIRIEYPEDLALAVDPVAGAEPAEWLRAVHPEDLFVAAPLFAQAFLGESESYSCELRVKDGERWRWLALYGAVVERGRRGTPRLIVGTYQDVTERREMERRVKESEERYRLVVEAQFAAVYDWTASDGTIRWSGGLRETFGHEPEALQTWDAWFEHVHPEDAGALRESLMRFHAERRQIWQAEYRFRHADGGYRHVRERGYAQRSADGTPIRMVGAIVDVSAERRLAEAELERRKSEALMAMAGGIAHEFNNLLTAILGNASLARSAGERAPELLPQLISDIEAAARRAEGLVQQVLDAAGAGAPPRGTADLSAVAREACALVRSAAPASLDLQVRVDGPVLVRGDATALSRAALQLLENAVEAAGQAGSVTVSARFEDLTAERLRSGEWRIPGTARPGRFGVLAVADSGPGVPPELRDRLFDPFFSTKFPGRGLGLAIVLGVAHRHHGAVSVCSAPGLGSTFSLAVPVA